MSWWLDNPNLLEEELAALRDAGIACEIDDDAQQLGVLALDLQYDLNGERYALRAVFPHEYPEFPPQVYAPESTFERHQNPSNKHLCLMGNRTQEWVPSTTLAAHLEYKFVWLVEDNINPQAPDEPQADPRSGYFPYTPSSHVLVDSAWNMPPGHGKVILKGNFAFQEDTPVFQGVVQEIHWRKHPGTIKWFGNIPKFYDTRIEVPVTQIGTPDVINDPTKQLALLAVLHPRLKKRNWVKVNKHDRVAMVGVTFKEEIAPDRMGPVWMFFLCWKKGKGVKNEEVLRVRSYRAGRTDFGIRVPSVQILEDKTVLVVGCGAVGAPIIMELAKSGMKDLRILDGDIVDPGPTIRWPLGLPHYSKSKAHELATFLNIHYPHASVRPYHMMIGRSYGEPLDDSGMQAKHLEALQSALNDVDMIVDASAEVAVENYLSNHAREHGISYIYAAATPGAAGGLIGRIMPDDPQGCWFCLQDALYRDNIIPEPQSDDDGEELPPGCCHPTFTGAAYDLGEVSLQAIRAIVSAFKPDAPSIFLRLSFDGDLGLPLWERFDIPVSQRCPSCQA